MAIGPAIMFIKEPGVMEKSLIKVLFIIIRCCEEKNIDLHDKEL